VAKHRQEDRDKGLTGETDPQKIKAELDRIAAAEEAERQRVVREMHQGQQSQG